MTSALKFEDCFWGGEFTSTKGFDALHAFMKDGKTFTDDVVNFFKARAQVEDTYAKGLAKLAKNAGGTTETGTLRDAWRVVTEETMETSREHQQLSKVIVANLEKPVRDLRDEQRNFRKKLEEPLKKAAKTKEKRFNANEKARKLYDSRCREAERADEESKAPSLQKDQEKLRAKAKKARQAAEAADSAYKEAVDKLDEARRIWEGEMDEACRHFQEMEEERRDLLRRTFWEYSNHVSEISVTVDKRAESMRKTLEQCDVDADVQNFVRERQTGTRRPAPILYQNFYAAPAAALPARAEVPKPAPQSSPAGETYVTAAFAYDKQGDLELQLNPGDRVRLISRENDTWWKGELNGKIGMFPASFVK
eukprot:m.23081 g.23081  ORF g.23081 m.23081 type:complete len:365 (+) comp11333_c0_seq1:162-1256(+)